MIKFRLDEDETLEETKLVETNYNKRQKKKDAINNRMKSNSQNTIQNIVSDMYSQENSQEEPREEQEKTSAEHVDDTQVNIDRVTQLTDYFEKNNPEAYAVFKKGIGNHLNDSNFPFNKLMRLPEFAQAIGVNLQESLTEAGLLNTVGGLIGDKLKDKQQAKEKATGAARWKAAKNTKSISKFVRAYNALLDVDSNLANQYLDRAKGKSILCDAKLYTIDKEQIPNALNIDVAGWLNTDREQGKKVLGDLRNSVYNNTVDQLSTYNVRSNDSNEEKVVKKAVEIAKKNPKVKAAIQKELK